MRIERTMRPVWGMDPEVFVRDSNGQILPSWKFLPEKKDAIPWRYEARPLYFGVPTWSDIYRVSAYTDGFQAEWSQTPASCIWSATDGVKQGLEAVLKAARTHDSGAKLTLEPTVRIPDSILQSETDEHLMLGCKPSKNVYFMGGDFPGDPRELTHRFAGAHIHLSNIDKEKNERYVKAFDKILAVYIVGAAASFDMPLRRKYYGLAGEYREPEYGLEYRTLSNIWLCHPGVTNLVLNIARGIVYLVDNNMDEMWVAGDELTIETVNNCDVKAARDILKANEPLLGAIITSGLHNSYKFDDGYPNGLPEAIRMGQNGFESTIKDPMDLHHNWSIGKEFGREEPSTWLEMSNNAVVFRSNTQEVSDHVPPAMGPVAQ